MAVKLSVIPKSKRKMTIKVNCQITAISHNSIQFFFQPELDFEIKDEDRECLDKDDYDIILTDYVQENEKIGVYGCTTHTTEVNH
jgi:hypothetical protein